MRRYDCFQFTEIRMSWTKRRTNDSVRFQPAMLPGPQRAPSSNRKEEKATVVWPRHPPLNPVKDHLARHCGGREVQRQAEEELDVGRQRLDLSRLSIAVTGNPRQFEMEEAVCCSFSHAPLPPSPPDQQGHGTEWNRYIDNDSFQFTHWNL